MKNWEFLLILILVGTLVGNVCFWQYYTNNLQNLSDSAFQSGNEVGYHLGYDDGNQSGYSLGYLYGYDNGNTSGYDDGCEAGYLIGYYDGNETGFDYGYISGVEDGKGRGHAIRDPILDEAIAFMTLDKTDENDYSENYTCINFAADFKNNAFQANYRCGFVYISFAELAHAIVCFNTTDNDLIFIEPQSDDIVNITIGQPYFDRSKYEPPEYNDTVVSFLIIW